MNPGLGFLAAMPRFASALQAKEPVVTPRAAPDEEPSPDEIRLRAFQIYERRGREPGHEAADWEQARRELLQERRRVAARVP